MNWDGDDVPTKPWWDFTLATIDEETKIKAWHATVAGIIIIVVLSLLGLICLIVSWRKRK